MGDKSAFKCRHRPVTPPVSARRRSPTHLLCLYGSKQPSLLAGQYSGLMTQSTTKDLAERAPKVAVNLKRSDNSVRVHRTIPVGTRAAMVTVTTTVTPALTITHL